MKTKFTLAAFLICSFGFSQNQSNGLINSPTISPASSALSSIATERFRFGSGLITQLDTGTDFDFTTSSQWLSFGKLTSPNQTLYGYRAQRAGRGLIFGFTGVPQSSTPTLGTPVIEWVGNGTTTAGDLLFRTSPSSTSTVSTQVMKMRNNGTSLIGASPSFNESLSTFTFDNINFDVTGSPKVEINNINNGDGLLVLTERSVSAVPSLPNFGKGRAAAFSNKNSISGEQSTGISSFSIANRGISIGVNARAINTSSQTGGISYGILSTASGASTNYGVFGSAPTGNNNFAGYFNGRIFSTNALVVSDKTLKKDVKIEEDVIEKLKKLNPVTYNFITDKKVTGLNLSDRLQHGFVAQELEEVFPELVEEILNPIFNEQNEQIGTQKLKAVNYIGLISVLTSSINEMSKKIEVLEEKLNESKNTYVVNVSEKFTDAELQTIRKNSFVLSQNVPNPFTASTEISYSLPENENNVSLLILNLNGQLIKEYKLNEIKGTITIQENTLSKGLYLYGLVANGEEIIFKKMLVN